MLLSTGAYLRAHPRSQHRQTCDAEHSRDMMSRYTARHATALALDYSRLLLHDRRKMKVSHAAREALVVNHAQAPYAYREAGHVMYAYCKEPRLSLSS